MSSYTDGMGVGPGKLSKSRSKPVVKPILKKLSQSHSEKNSLDLDRGWDEQTSFGTYGGSLGREREGSFGGRDVSFSISTTDLNHSNSTSTNNGRSKYSHARSTSGTSHISIATSGSGHRNGSFVHPFQQIPRTSTPPLSYANSLASLEGGNYMNNAASSSSTATTAAGFPGPRDYSPTITEDDDDLLEQHHLQQQQQQHRGNYHATLSSSNPVVNNPASYPRRPSLASRTSSLSDIHSGPPSLRINTSRTNSNATSSRLVHVSSHSEINYPGGTQDSLAPNTAPVLSPLSSASPSTSVTAMSPLRTSLEGFRLRSRSDNVRPEIDPQFQRERIAEERRRWHEKEAIKEAKREAKRQSEEDRKKERDTAKETQRLEKEQKEIQARAKREAKDAARKQSFTHSTRNSSSDLIRPSITRKRTAPDAEKLAMGQQVGFASRNYENTDQGQEPVADEVMFEGPRRSQTAKRKTQSAWTTFVLWFRTRILRLHDNMAKR
ncbi:hypothetical protein CCHL11_05914 [Colletotrichum chlorophyti]|uniref:Uncharacterized protein n=1 Tax=Colletotrichum chlorophyti TaxID=708187 RepID=A0A1Q8RJ34_9PEZI|nr:hypothetical protein CCHL11_05914 [Colletotrichum chlorophyti]